MNTEALKKAGMDVDQFLERLMNNSALVVVLVKKFLEDKNYEGLVTAVEKSDVKTAEICCHTLKGMCGNMSLNGLFALFQTQLALFRAGNVDGAVSMMPEISEKFECAVTNLKAFVE